MTLGERIKANRQRQGISQAKLGELLLVSQQAVAKWEKSIAEPDSTALKTMASLFHTTTDELLGFTEITPELKDAGVGDVQSTFPTTSLTGLNFEVKLSEPKAKNI